MSTKQTVTSSEDREVKLKTTLSILSKLCAASNELRMVFNNRHRTEEVQNQAICKKFQNIPFMHFPSDGGAGPQGILEQAYFKFLKLLKLRKLYFTRAQQ